MTHITRKGSRIEITQGGELNAGFMLNTDFAVFYDLETNPAGQATCDVNIDSGTLPKCDPSETFNLAVTYANVTW